jgi:hypothetical protein
MGNIGVNSPAAYTFGNCMNAEKTNCPICSTEINSKNLDKHLRKAHGPHSPVEPSPEEIQSVSYNRVMYRCKQCKKLFGKSVAAKHLKDAHYFDTKNVENCHQYYFDETVRRVSRSSTSSESIRKGKPSPIDKPAQANLKNLQQASDNLKLHYRLWHKQNQWHDQGKSRREWREDLDNSLFHCEVCDRDVKFRNVDKHYKRVHQWDVKNRVRYKVHSRDGQTENNADLKEERSSPNDYFNRIQVVSAGAYGLGKNRKH